jgi:mono/diheme cytochrome c family protein
MPMQRYLRLLVLSGVLLIPAAAWAQDSAQIAAGADIYRDKCAECHGERLVNSGSSFDLRKLRADERARFDKSVNDGKGQMPAWAGQFSAEDMDALWVYIRSKAYD